MTAGQGTAVAECCDAWKASVGDYAATCPVPGGCYISHTVQMDGLRLQRKNNRELASVLTTEWATSGFYDGLRQRLMTAWTMTPAACSCLLSTAKT